jgi:hypothetical protein
MRTYMVAAFSLAFLSACDTAADQQPAWMFVLEHAVELFVLILTPIAVLLGQKLVSLLAARARIERTQAIDEQVEIIIRRASAFADEQARKALHSGKPVPTGQEKMAEAVQAAREWIDRAGLPTLATRELEKLIEASLGEESERPRFNTTRDELGGDEDDE